MGNILSRPISQGTQGTIPQRTPRNASLLRQSQGALFDLSAMQKSDYPNSLNVFELENQINFKALQKSVVSAINNDLVSEPLKKGTAIIVKTATDYLPHDGRSVRHVVPSNPEGYARVVMFARLNKKP